MLKRRISKLRLGLNSKGKPNPIKTSCRYFLQGIPVLSIFALLGIAIYSFIPSLFDTQECSAYCGGTPSCAPGYAVQETSSDCWTCVELAADVTPTASLNIGGQTIDETVSAGRGITAYRTHTVQLSGEYIKNYSLIIQGDNVLTLTNDDSITIAGANNTTGENMLDDTWGYAFDDAAVPNNSLHYNAPTKNNVTLSSATPNGTLNVENKKLVFAAKFGADTPEGNYKANVELSLVTTPQTLTLYSITYNANGGNNAPSPQTIPDYNSSYTFTLSDPGDMNKTGHYFLGWSKTSSSATAEYQAGAQLTLTETNPELTLYAVWQKGPTVDGFKGLRTMQSMTTSICSSANIGDTGELYDERDDSTYTIRKHEDEQCWMTQNLRITNYQMTPNDSNVYTNFTIPVSDASKIVNSSNVNAAYYNNNPAYGAYYTWYTATAGTSGIYASICPKGWRLPTSTHYANLLTAAKATTNNAAASAIIRNDIYKFQYAGFVSAGSLVMAGGAGAYASSSLSSDKVTGLFIGSSYVRGNDNGATTYLGYSIRCIAS